jgi:CO/xanthine dehydrogenase Mo-binding subunit
MRDLPVLADERVRFVGEKVAAVAAETEELAEAALDLIDVVYEDNPILHQGKIDGGLVQGYGYALAEGLRIEDGRVTTANLGDYKIPCAQDIPELETILLSPDLSLGIAPIGEGPSCAMSAAIVNAIVDVIGHQVEIPVSPEALLAP